MTAVMTLQTPSHVHVEYECELSEVLTADQVASRGLQSSDVGSCEPHQGPNISPDPQTSGERWGVYVLLTNGRVFGCDLVVSATGAYPNTSGLAMPSGQSEVSESWLHHCHDDLCSPIQLSLSDEGGVVIDSEMRSSLTDVYAAGDVCTANWANSQLWFQVLTTPSTVIACSCCCCCVCVCVCVSDETVDPSKTDGSVCCKSNGGTLQ